MASRLLHTVSDLLSHMIGLFQQWRTGYCSGLHHIFRIQTPLDLITVQMLHKTIRSPNDRSMIFQSVPAEMM